MLQLTIKINIPDDEETGPVPVSDVVKALEAAVNSATFPSNASFTIISKEN